MKTQPREVYGYGARLRTARRFPSAGKTLLIIIAGLALGAALS